MFVAAAIGIYLVGNLILKLLTPSILDQIVHNSAVNEGFMDKIGGYDGFKYTFDDYNFHNELPTEFSIIIFGKSQNVILEGVIIKQDTD